MSTVYILFICYLIIGKLLIFNSFSSYKDDKELKQDDRVRVVFESKEVFELIIDHATLEDAGEYKCVAVNPEGKDVTSGKISVTSK